MSDRFIKACNEKSESRGGMNLPEFRRELGKMYPKEKSKISKMKRKELEGWCQRKPKIKKEIKESKENYFLPDVPISEKHKKYCRCVSHVATKNTDKCYTSGEWKLPRKRRGKKEPDKPCVNPYPVCRSRIGSTGTRDCLKYMDLDKMPEDELKAQAKMKGLTVVGLKRKVEAERKKKHNRGRSRSRSRSRKKK